MQKLINVGFGNVVLQSRVVAVVSPGSSPMKRLRDSAKDGNNLVDATEFNNLLYFHLKTGPAA